MEKMTTTLQELDPRVRQIEELILEYYANPKDMSLARAALEIHQLYREDIDIAEQLRALW